MYVLAWTKMGFLHCVAGQIDTYKNWWSITNCIVFMDMLIQQKKIAPIGRHNYRVSGNILILDILVDRKVL